MVSTIKVSACSMFKVTIDGKTVVGNNEDYWNPNTRIWFEKGESTKYGAMYVGFDNFFPQGGVNEAGLVFDGFAMEYLAVTDTTGKKPVESQDEIFSFSKNILQTCSNVAEVKELLLKYNLAWVESALLFFVDKSGDYLIVEGDSLILGNDPSYIQSNFYPSCVKESKDVKIDFYQNGKKFLEENKADTSLSYCRDMMNAMHQDWGIGGTLYSTIYDLDAGLIYLYYHSDFETVVKFDLKAELEKGNHSMNIPELFPTNTEAQNQLAQYNATNLVIDQLDNLNLAKNSLKFQAILDQLTAINPDFRFESKINGMGYKWLRDHKNTNKAIQVFQLNCEIYPKSANTYDSLGEAYMANEQYKEALVQYKKAHKLNRGNTAIKAQIKKLKSLIKSSHNKS